VSRSRSARILRWVLGGLGVALLLAVGGFLLWALTPLGPSERALASLRSDTDVAVEQTADGWVFTPRDRDAVAGFVFYPGGRVDARSYAPLVRSVAERGYYAVLVTVPLSLAVLDMDAAGPALDAAPASVGSWVVGGHSLGGVAAASFASTDRRVDGLVLLASFPAESLDLSDSSITVSTLAGSNDLVLNRAAWDDSTTRLPEDAAVVAIQGGNHAQFGDYGPQPGDGEADITRARQQESALVSIVRVMKQAQRAD